MPAHVRPVYRTVQNNSGLRYLLFFLMYKYINSAINATIIRLNTIDSAPAALRPFDPEIKRNCVTNYAMCYNLTASLHSLNGRQFAGR